MVLLNMQIWRWKNYYNELIIHSELKSNKNSSNKLLYRKKNYHFLSWVAAEPKPLSDLTTTSSSFFTFSSLWVALCINYVTKKEHTSSMVWHQKFKTHPDEFKQDPNQISNRKTKTGHRFKTNHNIKERSFCCLILVPLSSSECWKAPASPL